MNQSSFLNEKIPLTDGADVPRRRLPAWLLSLLLHVCLFGMILLLMQRFSNGSGEVENKTGGIVLVDLTSETTEYLSEGDISDAAPDQPQQTPAPAIDADELPPDLPGMAIGESTLTGVGEDFSQSLSGANSLTVGNNSNQPFGGKITTEVFGVKGTGSRFVYVFDRSASMEDIGGKPLRAAKRQLLASLDSLGEVQQFQIIFYNDKTKTFRSNGGDGQMVFANDESKKRAERFVNSIQGSSGTDHLNALKLALSYGPDVVFLLTDAEGGFSAADLTSISHWNQSGAVINAIEFGIGRQKNTRGSLRRVASESRGQYIYKDVRSFRD